MRITRHEGKRRGFHAASVILDDAGHEEVLMTGDDDPSYFGALVELTKTSRRQWQALSDKWELSIISKRFLFCQSTDSVVNSHDQITPSCFFRLKREAGRTMSSRSTKTLSALKAVLYILPL